MGRKKDSTEKTSRRVVTYEDVKPSIGINVNREDYLKFLDITHAIRAYLDRPLQITKEELHKKFPDDKKMVNDVWYCVSELKHKYPMDMVGIVFDL